MQLEKIQINTPRVPELIMVALTSAIDQGKLQVGSELPSERDLSESLGVGRGSLRECLAILEFMGAIESRGSRKRLLRNSDYIRKVTQWVSSANQLDSRKTFTEFRRVIEVGIAELACQRATDDDLAAMEKAMLALENEPDKYMHDVEFHDALAVASHNAMLASTIHLVNNLIADVRIRFWDLPNYQEKTNLSHAGIYEAVKTRDAQKARHEMIEHLKIVDEFAQKYPERSDGLDEAPLPEDPGERGR